MAIAQTLCTAHDARPFRTLNYSLRGQGTVKYKYCITTVAREQAPAAHSRPAHPIIIIPENITETRLSAEARGLRKSSFVKKN